MEYITESQRQCVKDLPPVTMDHLVKALEDCRQRLLFTPPRLQYSAMDGGYKYETTTDYKARCEARNAHIKSFIKLLEYEIKSRSN